MSSSSNSGGWDFMDYILWNVSFGKPSSATKSNTDSKKDGDEIGFLESVFSFVFGDGNPNADMESLRWRVGIRYLFYSENTV